MTDQLLKRLKKVNPVDEGNIEARPVPKELLAAIASGEQEHGRRQRFFSRKRLLPVAGLAGVAIVAAVAALPGGSDQGSSGAVRALQAVASVARAQASTTPELPVGYSKLIRATLATVGDPPPYSFRVPTTIETWVNPDGSRRIRIENHPIEWPGPRDEARWRSHGEGAPPVQDGGEGSYDSDGISDKEVTTAEEFDKLAGETDLPSTADLPADPDQLVEIFSQAVPASDPVPINARIFDHAASVLLSAGSSPELRAAIYEVLANLDGVVLDGEAHDPLGRPGTAVSFDSNPPDDVPEEGDHVATRYTAIFDPDTSQPLAYREELLEPTDFIDSSLLSEWVLEESGRVADTQTRPGDLSEEGEAYEQDVEGSGRGPSRAE